MTNVQRTSLVALVVLLLASWPLGKSVMFVINPREQAVVYQFGRPVRTCREPGLYFKTPIQKVRRLPKTHQVWLGAGADSILENVQTSDGKKIEVTPWAIWQITDPEIFVRKLQTVRGGTSHVKTFVRGRMRDVITGNKLAEVLRNDPDRKMQYPLLADLMASMEEASREPAAARPPTSADAAEADALPAEQEGTREAILSQLEIEGIEIGREEIVRRIEEIVREELAESSEDDQTGRGIELVDVGIARIDFVDEVREAAFQRQIAFRQAIASWYENQGEQFKQEIINQTEAEVQKIEGDGKGEANRIKGEVEAEIMERYAQAIRETGEFYGFVRTLEAYQKAVGPNTRLVLTTDSQLFSLLKEAPPVPPLPTVEAPAEETATAEAADEKAEPKPPAAEEGPPEDEKSPAEKTSS